jgi:hypothetical protein
MISNSKFLFIYIKLNHVIKNFIFLNLYIKLRLNIFSFAKYSEKIFYSTKNDFFMFYKVSHCFEQITVTKFIPDIKYFEIQMNFYKVFSYILL